VRIQLRQMLIYVGVSDLPMRGQDLANNLKGVSMKTLLLMIALAFGVTESARAVTRTCDSCSSAKVLQLAEAELISGYYGAYNAPRGPLYIVDTVTGSTYKYIYRFAETVIPGTFGDGDEIEVTTWVEEQPAEQELKSAVMALAAVRGPTDFYDTSGPGLPTSAYDTVITPALYGPMSDWLVQNTSVNLAHQLIALWQLPNGSGVVIQVVWHYPDGSIEILQHDRANNRYTPVPESARDRDGNVVPRTRSDFSGGDNSIRVHTFGTISSINDFLVRAAQLGVTVVNGNAPRPPGTRTVIVCTGSDGNLSCVAQTLAM